MVKGVEVVYIVAWGGVLQVILRVVLCEVVDESIHVFVVLKCILVLEVPTESGEDIVRGVLFPMLFNPVHELLGLLLCVERLKGTVHFEVIVVLLVEAKARRSIINVIQVMHENLVILAPLRAHWLLDPLPLFSLRSDASLA